MLYIRHYSLKYFRLQQSCSSEIINIKIDLLLEKVPDSRASIQTTELQASPPARDHLKQKIILESVDICLELHLVILAVRPWGFVECKGNG